MNNKPIITCAVTGSGNTTKKHPDIPITPKEIADSAIEAARAGAAIVHIHVRDPKTGAPSMELELYREVTERIRDSSVDVIINLTTGPGARYVPSKEDPNKSDPCSTLIHPLKRVEHIVELKPEICSLDIATMNFDDTIFVGTRLHMMEMGSAIKDAGVKPEIEVFDLGHIRLSKWLIEKGYIESPPMYQLCLGINWGADSTVEDMLHLKNQLPQGAKWGGFGIGRHEFPMVAQAALLGGNVRVGLEDNLYIKPGEFAKSNAELVNRAVSIINGIGGDVATPKEAREIIGLTRA